MSLREIMNFGSWARGAFGPWRLQKHATRLALWHREGRNTEARAALSEPAAAPARAIGPTQAGDLDLRMLGEALARGKRWIIVPTMLAAVLSIIAVNLVTPRYKSEARILIDGRENIFLRPNGERNEERTALDPEAVTS